MTVKQIKVPFTKLTKILHMADCHIRLYKRHDEYREVFATLYDQLRAANNGSSVIVVAGDIVHAKTDLSPESVVLTAEFLTNLAKIAPTLVIPGNHDLNLANQNRLDALSPIISGINHENLHYLKDSGIYDIGKVHFGVFSILGNNTLWPTNMPGAGKPNIALFHGPLYNATTDIGYTITSRHHEVGLFDGYDMVLLGDIHRHQTLQTYDKQTRKPIVVYPSSLVQQNHGESLKGHGWCEWDVTTRSFIFRELPNTYGYYTLTLDNGKVPDHTDMPKNVRLRIFAGDTPQTEIKKIITNIRKDHNVHELAVSTYIGAKQGTSITPTQVMDISDISYQNAIITEYLREAMPNISDETLDKVMELNKTKNSELGIDDVSKKIFWKPLQLKFSNLFTYGDDNFIDFTTKNGVVGIFAPNASGKTSIAEAICFALYDRTPRTIKAASIMNYSKTKSYCEFKFELNGKTYVIERAGNKNKKDEVKMDVNFYELDSSGNKTSLNGEERRYTNEHIREYVGSYEDFILTTFSSSTQAGLLVDRGQSDRKDLLSQFMGLGLLDKLYMRANDESKEIAGALKTFKNDDFTRELSDIRDGINGEKEEDGRLRIDFDLVNTQLNETRDTITQLIGSRMPIVGYQGQTEETLEANINTEQTKLAELNDKTDKLFIEKTNLLELEKQKTSRYIELENTNIEQDYKEHVRLFTEYSRLDTTLIEWNTILRINTNRLNEASQHKFDINCEFCVNNGQHIIETKKEAELQISDAEQKIQSINQKKGVYFANMDALGNVVDNYAEWKTIEKELFELGKNKTIITNKLNENERISIELVNKYNQYIAEFTELKNNQDAIEHNKKINDDLVIVNDTLGKLKKQFTGIQTELTKTASRLAVLESKETDILNRIKKAEELESKYEVYEAYLMATHRDGLQYKLISDVLPMLEDSVNDILKQMSEFHLGFEMDGKNVNMKICYDVDRTWPLELASGMEKFISGLAIRVALMSISNLPKSNFLIIDEGLGALDADNLASIYMLFDVLKAKFDFIFLISHIETTRDISDSLIDIERKNGVSRIYSV